LGKFDNGNNGNTPAKVEVGVIADCGGFRFLFGKNFNENFDVDIYV
jgi:hypothetical protein